VIGAGDLYLLTKSIRHDGNVDFTGDGKTGSDDLFLFSLYWDRPVDAKQE